MGASPRAATIARATARERRKHHMGSAVLAMTLDAFKIGIRELHRTGHDALSCLDSTCCSDA